MVPEEESVTSYPWGSYSAPGFTITLTRNRNSFLMQTYMPSALFVFISWISFLIPHDSGERAALVVTLMLVIVSMFLSVVSNSPKGIFCI